MKPRLKIAPANSPLWEVLDKDLEASLGLEFTQRDIETKTPAELAEAFEQALQAEENEEEQALTTEFLEIEGKEKKEEEECSRGYSLSTPFVFLFIYFFVTCYLRSSCVLLYVSHICS